MADLTRLNQATSDLIMDLVGELGTCTAEQVMAELVRRHGVDAPLDQLIRYMEFLRSGFPRKLAHAGPGRWVLVVLA